MICFKKCILSRFVPWRGISRWKKWTLNIFLDHLYIPYKCSWWWWWSYKHVGIFLMFKLFFFFSINYKYFPPITAAVQHFVLMFRQFSLHCFAASLLKKAQLNVKKIYRHLKNFIFRLFSLISQRLSLVYSTQRINFTQLFEPRHWCIQSENWFFALPLKYKHSDFK